MIFPLFFRCVETGATVNPQLRTTTPRSYTRTTTPGPSRSPIFNPCTVENIRDGHLFFAVPGDERSYIHCSMFVGQATRKDCGEHHYFSEAIRTCLNKDPFDADARVFEDTDNPCLATDQTGKTQFYEYPGDPSKFIHCDQYGDAYIQECQQGLVWNPEIAACVRAEQLVG